jgi:hypothetical protein
LDCLSSSDKRSSETSEAKENIASRSKKKKKKKPEKDCTKRKTPKGKLMRAKSAEEEDTDGFPHRT